MTTTTTEQAERDALAAHVLGVERACAHCGRACRSTDVFVTADRLHGSGEHVWNVCADCGPAARQGQLTAVVVRDLLGLEPDDPALGQVGPVLSFHELAGRRPDRPSSEPWAHVDTSELAEQVTEIRNDRKRRECPDRAGCRWCGVSHTPPGTGWNQGRGGYSCGSCNRRRERDVPMKVGDTIRTFPFRDVVAAVLVGYDSGTHLTVPPNLGAELGVVFAHEAGVTRGSERPWAHLDIAAIRARNDELIALGSHHRPPSEWQRQRREGRQVGTVRW